MLSIRLSKIGKSNRAAYRIVVANKRSGRNGRFVETLGYFDPNQKRKLNFNRERFSYWINNGAQQTQSVVKLLKGL
ncbi:MAG: 30S ribosomal protein S16 [Patescibacteria group bacterium]|nr:30S ribosomal protein S16 [Patescibacteria group bacterium]